MKKAKLSKLQRVGHANELLRVIASCGRRFFAHEDYVACMALDTRGRVRFIDHYTHARIYPYGRHWWAKASAGGTLCSFVERLRDYIATGAQLKSGIWCDSWGYGPDLEKVRAAAMRLGIVCADDTAPALALAAADGGARGSTAAPETAPADLES